MEKQQQELALNDSLPPGISGYLRLIDKASSNPDIDVTKLEKLLEMQERILARGAETSFNASFSELQSSLPVITEKGEIKVNGQVRSKYALFEDINDQIKPILKEHGFAIMFKTSSQKNEITVTGILTHRDGHRESTDLTLEADTSGSKNSVQSIGSSVKYAKRYVLCALLNITTRDDKDDDGALGGNIQRVSEDQIANLKALAEEVKADMPKFCAYFKVDKIENLPASLYQSAVKAFEKKRRAA